jgi:dihydrofolate reductase
MAGLFTAMPDCTERGSARPDLGRQRAWRRERMASRVQMPSIAFIVARSYPENVIGCEKALPWRLKTDMKFFRQVTEEHAIIMGRKTYDSIGHPLPKRMNIVLTRQFGNDAHNLIWVQDRESALFFADLYSILHSKTQLIIIGGSEVYAIFSDLVNKVFLTEVFGNFKNGDAFFKEHFDFRKWRTIDEREYPRSADDQYPFRISIIERRLKSVRQRDISEFLTRDAGVESWMELAKLPEKIYRFEELPEEQYHLPLVAA